MRKISLATAVSLILASNGAHALGLGDIEMRSALNQPMNAEIPLTSVQTGELDGMIVQLASPEAFVRAGIDRSQVLAELEFEIDDSGSEPIIRITSDRPVLEPFLNFLIELDWPAGRMVREYTVLLDPPVFLTPSATATPDEATATVDRTELSQVAPTPIVRDQVPVDEPVPATGDDGDIVSLDSLSAEAGDAAAETPASEALDEGEVVSLTDLAAPNTEARDELSEARRLAALDRIPDVQLFGGTDEVGDDFVTEPAEPQVAERGPAVDAGAGESDVVSLEDLEAPESEQAETKGASAAGASEVTVGDGDTLLQIARSNLVDGASVQQMMLALLDANQQAFIDGNINLVRAGATLDIPAADAVNQISQRQALARIAEQNTLWQEYRDTLRGTTRLASSDAAPETADSATDEAAPETDESTDTALSSEAQAILDQARAEVQAREELRILGTGDSQVANADAVPGDSEAGNEAALSKLSEQAQLLREELTSARLEGDDLSDQAGALQNTTENLDALIALRQNDIARLESQLNDTRAAAEQAEVEAAEAEAAAAEAAEAGAAEDEAAEQATAEAAVAAIAAADQAAREASELTDESAEGAGDLAEQAGDAVDSATEQASDAADSAAETAGAAVDGAAETAGAAVDGAAETAGAAVDGAAETAGAAVDSAAETAGAAVDSAAETAGAAVDSAADALDEATDNALTQSGVELGEVELIEGSGNGSEDGLEAGASGTSASTDDTSADGNGADSTAADADGSGAAGSQPAASENDAAQSAPWYQNVLSDPNKLMIAGAGGAGLLGLLALLFMRRKGGEDDYDELEGFDDEVEFIDEAEADELSASMRNASNADIDDAMAMAFDEPEEPSQTDTRHAPKPAAGVAGDTAPGRGVDGIDKDDTIAEADVYLAYGLHGQAEDLLTSAIDRNPANPEYHTKLLQTYHAQGNAEGYGRAAADYQQRFGEQDDRWSSIAGMGAELDPGNALYASAAGAVASMGMGSRDAALNFGDDDFMVGEDTGGQTGSVTRDFGAAGETVDFDNDANDLPDQSLDPAMAFNEADLEVTGDFSHLSDEVSDEPDTGDLAVPDTDTDDGSLDQSAAGTAAGAVAGAGAGLAAAGAAAASLAGHSGEGEDGLIDAPELMSGDSDASDGGIDLDLTDDPTNALDGDLSLDDLDVSGGNLAANDGLDQLDLSAAAADLTVDLDQLSEDIDLDSTSLFEEGFADAGLVEVDSGLPGFNGGGFNGDGTDTSADEMDTMMDLAKAYIDMGDKDLASNALDQIVKGGSPQQVSEAETLLRKIS